MGTVGEGYGRARTKIAAKAARLLPDTCRLIVGEDEYENVPCRFRGVPEHIDGAPYRIEFAWGSPAEIGAAAIVDAVEGRPQITLQLRAPADSSTSLWQEWKATAGPAFGRVDVGL